mmetsp:Transcript_21052/g.39559  ORF Transcript_21052/g.39559 Transcript_21052/m.39559 type:complete len:203 (-) Transcript_21052:195-803(-)
MDSSWHGRRIHLASATIRTGFLAYDPEKLLCAGGGAWYDCRLNKWGDGIVACEKWCGLPPIIPMFWKKTMLTNCEFANAHPDETGFPKLPLPDLQGAAMKKLANSMTYEPWRGWPIREAEPMAFNPNGGLPDDSTRSITKICCAKPIKKCLTIGEPTVVVRSIPVWGMAPLLGEQGEELLTAPARPHAMTRNRGGAQGQTFL